MVIAAMKGKGMLKQTLIVGKWLTLLGRLPGDLASDGGKKADYYVGNGLYILTANAGEFPRQSDKATEEAGWMCWLRSLLVTFSDLQHLDSWSYIMYE
ncbi:hypothetical protein MY3957_004798 [Beauveria namnaoensis]